VKPKIVRQVSRSSIVSSHRKSLVRSALRVTRLTAAEIGTLVPLLQAYMHEAYGVEWMGSNEALQKEAIGQKCTVELAWAAEGALIGFLAWIPSYDLHHCIAGVDILDLYIVPPRRGRGIALQLACALAAEELRRGALYMRGTAIETGSGLRLYSRFGACDPTGCIVSGRAFRRLAELAGRPVREIVRSLPERSWNYEA
jgi:GNAT superfamily N-acetyltransferase